MALPRLADRASVTLVSAGSATPVGRNGTGEDVAHATDALIENDYYVTGVVSRAMAACV